MEKKLENQKLLELVENLGDTPTKEPKLYKIITSTDEDKWANLVKTVLGKKDSIDNYTMEEFGLLIDAIKSRVVSIKDEDGNYKSTPNTEDMNLPKPSVGMKMFALAKKKAIGVDVDDDIDEQIEKLVWEASGLNKDDLSDWEQVLVSEQIQASVYNPMLTAEGMNLKN